jgi:hypothetical protein
MSDASAKLVVSEEQSAALRVVLANGQLFGSDPEVPTRFSVPGLTASDDSKWFALYGPGLHVPANGTLDPAGTG